MTREEAKEVFLNRGFINGIYDGNKWREACIVISEWLEQEPKSEWKYDHAILKAYSDGANEVLDKLRAEILCNIIEDDTSGNTPAKLRSEWEVANKAHMVDIAIIDKYRAESEDKE